MAKDGRIEFLIEPKVALGDEVRVTAGAFNGLAEQLGGDAAFFAAARADDKHLIHRLKIRRHGAVSRNKNAARRTGPRDTCTPLLSAGIKRAQAQYALFHRGSGKKFVQIDYAKLERRKSKRCLICAMLPQLKHLFLPSDQRSIKLQKPLGYFLRIVIRKLAFVIVFHAV